MSPCLIFINPQYTTVRIRGTAVTRTRYPDLGVTPTGSTWTTADTDRRISRGGRNQLR
jgi:hypothetical protein